MPRVAGFLLVCAVLLSISSLALADAASSFIDINGIPVTQDEFNARLERVPVETTKMGKTVTVPAGQYVVEQIITERLLTQLAERDNVVPTDGQLDEKLNYLKKSGNLPAQLRQMGVTGEDWKRQMMLQQTVVNLLVRNAKVSDADVRKTYDAQLRKTPSPFVRPAACHIAVIICKKHDKIQKAYKLLLSGQEFGSVAMQLSEDKTTAPYNGVVGWLSMDMNVVPMPIRKTASALGVGKYSHPFFVQDKSDKAWVILKVDQKRPKVVQSFDEVKDVIREQIAIAKADRIAFNKELQDFIQGSEIVVNSERYRMIPEMMKKSAMTDATLGQAVPSPAPAK